MPGPFGGLLAPVPVTRSDYDDRGDDDYSLDGILAHSASPRREPVPATVHKAGRIAALEEQLAEAEQEANYLRHRHHSLATMTTNSASPQRREHTPPVLTHAASPPASSGFRIVQQCDVPLEVMERVKQYQNMRERFSIAPQHEKASFLVPVAP
eukprot:TRINITY_DN5320_c0_g1_i1.p1 TRINITY_DN5320_c0_g1~~TRINITY_DN5320_c0_g1_i1.p1  ORF type:complete len:154 (+),score=8.80 TRINITY_DN5320_c0_g1_i1:50-511(+)